MPRADGEKKGEDEADPAVEEVLPAEIGAEDRERARGGRKHAGDREAHPDGLEADRREDRHEAELLVDDPVPGRRGRFAEASSLDEREEGVRVRQGDVDVVDDCVLGVPHRRRLEGEETQQDPDADWQGEPGGAEGRTVALAHGNEEQPRPAGDAEDESRRRRRGQAGRRQREQEDPEKDRQVPLQRAAPVSNEEERAGGRRKGERETQEREAPDERGLDGETGPGEGADEEGETFERAGAGAIGGRDTPDEEDEQEDEGPERSRRERDVRPQPES